MKYGENHANYGNTYYKSNIGKKYNNIVRTTNSAERITAYKILMHFNSNNHLTHISTIFDDGHINEVHSPDRIPKPTRNYISKWHSITCKYVRDGKTVMTDIEYNKYLTDDKIVIKGM